MLRLIRKWIQVGQAARERTGTGQGQTISPLLANIYLHYVLDEWYENEVKPRLRGEAHEIRFADDAVLCFQYKEDAEKVMEVLPKRFADSVNLIWLLLIFSFGPTPLSNLLPHPGRSGALRRPKGDAFRAKRRPGRGKISNSSR